MISARCIYISTLNINLRDEFSNCLKWRIWFDTYCFNVLKLLLLTFEILMYNYLVCFGFMYSFAKKHSTLSPL